MAAATIATIPRWMRTLGGFDQPAWLDAAVMPMARAAVRVAQQPMMARATLRALAPSALPVMEQVIRGDRPLRDEVLTPAQARERFGGNAAALKSAA